MSKRVTRVEAADKKAGMTPVEINEAMQQLFVKENGELLHPTRIKVEAGFGRQIKAIILEEDL